MVRIAISQNDIKWWPKKSVLSKGKKAMAAIYRVNKKNSSISHQLSYVIQLWMKWSGKRTLSLGWIVGLFYFSFHLIGRFQDTMNLYGNIDGELAWKIIHTSPSPTHTHHLHHKNVDKLNQNIYFSHFFSSLSLAFSFASVCTESSHIGLSIAEINTNQPL